MSFEDQDLRSSGKFEDFFSSVDGTTPELVSESLEHNEVLCMLLKDISSIFHQNYNSSSICV